MKARTIFTTALICASLVLASAVAAQAASYYVYKQCASANNCDGSAYTSKSGRKMITFSLGKKCDDGSMVTIVAEKLKISKTGHFSAEVKLNIWKMTEQLSYTGTAQITGKVKRKKKVTGSVTVTTEAPNCGSLSGNYRMKYAYTQTGG